MHRFPFTHRPTLGKDLWADGRISRASQSYSDYYTHFGCSHRPWFLRSRLYSCTCCQRHTARWSRHSHPACWECPCMFRPPSCQRLETTQHRIQLGYVIITSFLIHKTPKLRRSYKLYAMPSASIFAVQYNIIEYNTMQCTTMQCNTIQYNTTHCIQFHWNFVLFVNVPQVSTVRNGINGLARRPKDH